VIFAEGILVAAWMIAINVAFLFIKIAARHTWASTSLGTFA
jgi:hypothetical protein